jgi:hypothetical protein
LLLPNYSAGKLGFVAQTEIETLVEVIPQLIKTHSDVQSTKSFFYFVSSYFLSHICGDSVVADSIVLKLVDDYSSPYRIGLENKREIDQTEMTESQLMSNLLNFQDHFPLLSRGGLKMFEHTERCYSVLLILARFSRMPMRAESSNSELFEPKLGDGKFHCGRNINKTRV